MSYRLEFHRINRCEFNMDMDLDGGYDDRLFVVFSLFFLIVYLSNLRLNRNLFRFKYNFLLFFLLQIINCLGLFRTTDFQVVAAFTITLEYFI